MHITIIIWNYIARVRNETNYIARVKNTKEDYVYRESLQDKFQVAIPPTSPLSCWKGFSTKNLVPDVLVH